jgi:hypothetical protein
MRPAAVEDVVPGRLHAGDHRRGDLPAAQLGRSPTLVLAEDARAFAERLRSASANPVVYAELPSGRHTFDLFESLRFASVVDGIEAFAALIRSRQAHASVPGKTHA